MIEYLEQEVAERYKLDKDRDRNRTVRATNNAGAEGGKKWKRYGGEERRREKESRRRSAAHRGLILTFLSGPGLPVSFQMNGNCPAGFNHVLNWQKHRRKALLRQLRIDRAGSRPIAGPLYPPRRESAHTHTHNCLQTHVHGLYMCAPVSEQRTEALITVMAR